MRAAIAGATKLFPFAAAGVAGVAGALAFPRALPFAASADAPSAALDPGEWRDFKLLSVQKLTHNTSLFRFEVPPGKSADLPVASCLLTKAALQGPEDEKPKLVIRPYTPVSSEDPSHLDLVVKVYEQGKMSKHIGSLKPGDSLALKGPIPKYPYSPNTKAHIGMIAGGSGITPMLQVVEEVVRRPEDETQVSLVFANVTEQDIILKARLDTLAAKHANFKVFYVVEKPSWGGIFWKGGVGYVTREVVEAHLPPPGPENLIMVCGPPPMMNALSGDKAPDKSQGPLTGLLKSLGYTEDMVYKF